MRRRILAFSFFPAFLPPNNGGVERLYRIYSHLSERFDVTLISSSHVDVERQVIVHGPNFHEVRVPKEPRFENFYMDLERHAGEGDISGPALAMTTTQFGALHEEYLRHHPEADLIIHDSPFLIRCDLFRGFDGKPRIYQSYNFETGLYGGFHSQGRQSRVEEMVRDLEQETCDAADLITGCSHEDLEAFRSSFAPTVPLVLIPNGFTPSFETGRSKRSDNRLIFLGSGHRPNIEAVELIRNKLAPRLPQFEFHLVGSCWPAGREGNVIAHGFVDPETKRRLLEQAAAAINPMASGSGSSLKVADIADHHLPLLSTPMGARGFDLEPDVHYASISIENVVDDVRRALEDRSRLKEIADRSFEHFRKRFTWKSIAGEFADRIEELCERKRPPSPRLVINDYDSLAGVGGGATRTRGLCRGLSETSKIIFLTFGDDRSNLLRRVELDGQALVIQVPKTNEHVSRHQSDEELHWVSTADLVNYVYAPANEPLREIFRCAAATSSVVLCEHPYMVGLPRHFSIDFVYSSQNFELKLKGEGLADHPRRSELMALAEEAESYACGASGLIVTVSEEDSRQISGHFRFTAPIVVIPNGSDAPVGSMEAEEAKNAAQGRPTAVFMGSAHMPNIEAAKWIADELAPSLPDVDFLILGSVGNSLPKSKAKNLTVAGQVSAERKSRLLYNSDVAINPMKSGSGSNVKMADFLQHGLPVISTKFGARGYEGLPDHDVVIEDLSAFEQKLSEVIAAPETRHARIDRAQRFAQSLSMDEGGRTLAAVLDEHAGRRKRALHVTYRYNEPHRGGGEAHVVRLVHSLARSGWFVDVVSPAAENIEDVHRFGARFSGPDFQPTPTGKARVRSGKFPLDAVEPDPIAIERIWNAQPAYEETLARSVTPPDKACLAWGWADPDVAGRWSLTQAAIYLPAVSQVSIVARAIAPVWLQIRTEEGEVLHDANVSGPIRFETTMPAGFVEFSSSVEERFSIEDSRPLGLRFETLEVDGVDLLQQQLTETWKSADAGKLFDAHTRAQKAARGSELRLTDLRIGSTALLDFVEKSVHDYDLLITHNAVFGAATGAIAAAKAAGVPSVFIPHLHFDDDFYHFADVLEACRDATATLVAPKELTRFLENSGLSNVRDHGPGVDAQMTFTAEDSAEFRKVLGRDDDFFLVLGRKAAAKGYKDVIAAAEKSSSSPLIVLIGPDDDREPISSDNAIYLGAQPLSVVRGALRECLGLVNMSRSESFGMVLVEAGLAGKPVLANSACAAFQDLVEDGANGYLVDTEQLPNRLSELATAPELRRKLGEEARRRSLSHDWQKVEEDFVALCNSLAANP